MKLIEFPEQTTIVAKDQPQYRPMPAWIDSCKSTNPEGRLICKWKLSLKERIKLLFTGILWHHILTFHSSIQPQLLSTEFPFNKE